MKEVRTIKRYQNRKLYDTFQSCYVTLEEIAQIIREGYEIQVIDNKTKRDITYMTQIQLLFDQERKAVNAATTALQENGSETPLDTELLKEVIRSPEGTFTGYIQSLRRVRSSSEQEAQTIPPTIDRFGSYVQSGSSTNTSSVETTPTLN